MLDDDETLLDFLFPDIFLKMVALMYILSKKLLINNTKYVVEVVVKYQK